MIHTERYWYQLYWKKQLEEKLARESGSTSTRLADLRKDMCNEFDTMGAENSTDSL